MKKNAQAKFALWLTSRVGHSFLQLEKRVLKNLPGMHRQPIVLLGESEQKNLVEPLSLLVSENNHSELKDKVIVAHFNALPLQPDSIEHIVLPHTLDFFHKPNTLLREMNIALRADGYVTIIGFNPLSLWNVRRFVSLRKKGPWAGKFRPIWQVKSWLEILNYDVILCKKQMHRLPFFKGKLFDQLACLEPIQKALFPFAGAIYVIVAKKKVFGITPLRNRWKKIPKVLSRPAMKPSLTMKQEKTE